MNLGILSLISGIISALLVFTDFFKTPPLAITIFALIALALGFKAFKKDLMAKLGSALGLVSLAYLIYLFAALGG